MARSLRSGVNCLCWFSFPFRMDVFTYFLVAGEGNVLVGLVPSMTCMIFMPFISPQIGLVVVIG